MSLTLDEQKQCVWEYLTKVMDGEIVVDDLFDATLEIPDKDRRFLEYFTLRDLLEQMRPPRPSALPVDPHDLCGRCGRGRDEHDNGTTCDEVAERLSG